MTLATVNYVVITTNSSSFISSSNIAPGENFYFNTAGGNTYFSGSVIAPKISGSLQQLSTGIPYLIAGDGININSQSNGQVAISSSITQSPVYFYSTTNNIVETSGSLRISGSLRVPSTIDAQSVWITSSVGSVLNVSGNSTFAGPATFVGGLSGSLTKLADGTSYLIAGTNITITSASNGAITINSTGGSIPSYFFSNIADVIETSGSLRISGSLRVSSSLDAQSVWITSSAGSVLNVSGNSTFAGPATFVGGLSGSLTKLSDGTSYIIAGDNVTVTSASNGAITISAVAGGGGSGDPAAQYLVLAATSSLSNERVFTPGPGLMVNDGGANGIYAVSVSLAAGPGITITSQSNNQIAISSSAASKPTFLFAGSLTTTNQTGSNPQSCGQFVYVPSEHYSGSVILRSIISVDVSTPNTASVRLWNFTSGAYVDLGGVGIQELKVSSSTPTIIESSNLYGAASFNTSSTVVYEVRLNVSSSATYATLGSSLIVTNT